MTTKCGHCGFAGTLAHKGNIVAEEIRDHIGYSEITITILWVIDRCPACGEPTLSEFRDGIDDPVCDEPRRIYPTARDNSALPKSIKDSYDRALRIKMIDPGFYAVSIRRMLEVVCNEHAIPQGNLYTRLTVLAQREAIPARLADQAQELRKLGNLGAHEKDIDVDPADVPVIEDFAEAVLEYLYRAPAKLSALRASLDERRTA